MPSAAASGGKHKSADDVEIKQKHAKMIAEKMRGHRPVMPPSGSGSNQAETIFNCYLNPKTGHRLIVPQIVSGNEQDGFTSKTLKPLSSAKLRKPPSSDPKVRGWMPPAGSFARPGYVWACHLMRCVDEETDEVWYEPVLFVIEEAKAPNNRPIKT